MIFNAYKKGKTFISECLPLYALTI